MRKHTFYRDASYMYEVIDGHGSGNVAVRVVRGLEVGPIYYGPYSGVLLAVMTHIAQRLFDAAGVTPRKGNQRFQA